MWASKSPVGLGKFRSRLLVLNIGRQFKGFARYLWSVNESNKLARFTPQIFLSAPGDVFQSARRPIGNGGKDRARRRRALGFPKVGDNRLPRWEPFQSVDRHRKIFRPDVFTESKKRVMSSEVVGGNVGTKN